MIKKTFKVNRREHRKTAQAAATHSNFKTLVFWFIKLGSDFLDVFYGS